MTDQDPKAIIQAHVMRAAAIQQAVLHGEARPRSARRITRLLWGSVILTIVIVGGVSLASRISTLLQHSGR